MVELKSSELVAPIDERTWIAWRTKLGCRKGEAKRLYAEYLKLVRQSAGKVRRLKPRHNETFEQALRAFLDSMPRAPPVRFFALVARSEQLRAIKEHKRLIGRARYERRFNRRRHA